MNLKPGNVVRVTNPASPHHGSQGVIVSIATTKEYQAVSVRFAPGDCAVWFFSKHVELI